MNNKQTNNRRPEIVTKEYPENDLPYETIKHRPGNSTYASGAKQGKKIAILSDSSITTLGKGLHTVSCSRVQQSKIWITTAS